MTALPKPMKRAEERKLQKQIEKEDYQAACAYVDERDRFCVVSKWSKVKCYSPNGKCDHDHIVPLGRGGQKCDPANIQLLCRCDHELKGRLVEIAETLGLYGSEAQDLQKLKFALGNPNGNWDDYIHTLKEIWDIEKRKHLGVDA